MAIKKAMLFLLFIMSPVSMMAKRSVKPRDKYVLATRLQDAANDAADTCTTRCRSCCPLGWVRNGDKCYFIDDTPTLKYADARLACQNMGADLAVIESAEENEFIRNLVVSQSRVTPMGTWLGLKRNEENSDFYWVNGNPLEGGYKNWAVGEPNHYRNKENCGHMYGNGKNMPSGKWNDFLCEYISGFWSLMTSDDVPVILCQKPL